MKQSIRGAGAARVHQGLGALKSVPKAKSVASYDQVQVLDHPVIQHKLCILRDRKTSALGVRQVTDELSQFLAYEVTRDLKTMPKVIDTPIERTTAQVVAEDLVLVAIMRAGNGMLAGMLKVLPFATVGHIGIYRDKFIESTVEYYLRFPKHIQGKRILLLDPLLATGDTACAAMDRLKQYEVGAIRLVTLLAAPEGLTQVQARHPDVGVTTLSIERELNDQGMILPGLGDAGNRLYDTL